MIVPEPKRNVATDYRYGFQGQEKDDEIKGGEGNSLNYTFRMHDPRAGRFFAVDPLAPQYPHNSPYAFAENRVIDGIELEGLEYYDADECLVEVQYGITKIKVENLSGPSKIALSDPILDNRGVQTGERQWKGDIVLGTSINVQAAPMVSEDKLSSSGQVNKTFSGKQPGSAVTDLRPQKADGSKDERFSSRKIGGGVNVEKAPGGVRAVVAVKAINIGLEKLHIYMFKNDLNLTKEHHKTLSEKIFPAIKKALANENGNYIPSYMINTYDLSQIANVMLYGGDGYDADIMEAGMKIYYELTDKGKKEKNKMDAMAKKIKTKETDESVKVKDNTNVSTK